MGKEKKESLEVAGKQYSPEDYQNQDPVSNGLAMTHEQVSDAYVEGEIKGVIVKEGKDIEIPRKGYNE